MKRYLLGLTSATVLSCLALALAPQVTQAQFTIDPKGPFIARAFTSGGLARDHIIQVGVAEISLTGLDIQCQNLNDASGVVVRNQDGKLLASTDGPGTIDVENTKITIEFEGTAEPGDTLNVDIEGIVFNQDGGVTLYYVSAMNPDVPGGSVPVGTARVITPDRSGSN